MKPIKALAVGFTLAALVAGCSLNGKDFSTNKAKVWEDGLMRTGLGGDGNGFFAVDFRDMGDYNDASLYVDEQEDGSYVIRSREQERKPKTFLSRIFGNSVGTDVDFYLLVDSATEDDLNGMAEVVAQEFRSKGFSIDGALNGRNPDNAFDLSKVDGHIEVEAYDLLSLPFKYVQGHRISESQRAVIEAVQKRRDAQQIWEQIKFYHDSPLTLYHGTFDPKFIDYVSENWVPKKVSRFGLPPLESMLSHR